MNYYIRKSSAGSWSELPVTGKNITWAQGDTQARNAADYRLLMASGMFDAGDVDPVFGVSNSLTGKVELTAGGLPVDVGGSTELPWRNFVTGIGTPKSNISAGGGTTATQMFSRSAHHARASVTALKIVIPHFYADAANGDVAPGSTGMTIKATIEYPASTFTTVNFAGGAIGNLPAVGMLVSDAVTVTIPKGALFWVRTYRSGGVNGTFPMVNGMNTALGEFAQYGATTPDLTTTAGGGGSTGSGGFKPVAIIAQTSEKCFLLLGGSRVAGIGDASTSTHMDVGLFARSIGPVCGYINAGISGDRGDYFVSAAVYRKQLAQWCSHIVCAYGTNDLGASKTAAEIAATMQQMRAIFPDLPFYMATLAPETTDATNTVTASSNAQRVAFNTMVRAGIAGLSGWVEGADPIESARDSGFWRLTSDTGDGKHATQQGYLWLAQSGEIRPQLMP